MNSSLGTFSKACLIRSDVSKRFFMSQATFATLSRARSSLRLLGDVGGGMIQPCIVASLLKKHLKNAVVKSA
jgi:hypothetical protein